MTRTKKYGEETVLYSKRVPASKIGIISDLVEKYLAGFDVSGLSRDLVIAGTAKVKRNGVISEAPKEKLRIESNGIWLETTNPKEKLMITTNESGDHN